jgi:hypothetical protein
MSANPGESAADAALDLAKAAFAKWIPRLGLAWWDIEVAYYDDPREIVDRFRVDEDGLVAANLTANWMYAMAKIQINLPALAHLSPDHIERIAVHELCHILVNEMREGELHHEERVVTGLTKAFFWVEDAASEGK